MKKIIMAAVVGLGLVVQAHAADTSTSIVTRQAPKPVGEWPPVSYVHATATATGSMTYDVLPPKAGVPTSKITGCQTTVESSTGKAKLLTSVRSGLTVTISAGTSDTLAVSDTARTICVLKP